MSDESKRFKVFEGEGFGAVSIPYGDGNASMYIFLPDYNSSLKKLNENGPKIILDENSNLFEESKVLMLDNSFAKKLLKWYPQFSIYESIEKTVDWYRSYYNNEDIKNTSLKQLRIYYDQLGVNI